jgi:hypothetical protein
MAISAMPKSWQGIALSGGYALEGRNLACVPCNAGISPSILKDSNLGTIIALVPYCGRKLFRAMHPDYIDPYLAIIISIIFGIFTYINHKKNQ